MHKQTVDTTLHAWLEAVNCHLANRRTEVRPSRSRARRDREKARKEARRLFAEHYRRIALGEEILAA